MPKRAPKQTKKRPAAKPARVAVPRVVDDGGVPAYSKHRPFLRGTVLVSPSGNRLTVLRTQKYTCGACGATGRRWEVTARAEQYGVKGTYSLELLNANGYRREVKK